MAEAGRNDKYFQYSSPEELQAELVGDKKSAISKGAFSRKKAAMKRIIANATMGNDMSSLFPTVVECMGLPDLELKKMVYLYLNNYGRIKKDLLPSCINNFLADAKDADPMVRSLALRTMSSLLTAEMVQALLDPLRISIFDKASVVRKTAAMCIAKVYAYDPNLIERAGFIENLYAMLMDSHVGVASNAVMSLYEISEHSNKVRLSINFKIANKLVHDMRMASEWGHAYMLELLLFYVPQTSQEAELLAESVSNHVRSDSSTILLASTKVVIYLMNYIANVERREMYGQRVSKWLLSQLAGPSEIQFVTLRNILLLIQRRPMILRNNIKAFYCKYNDPAYIKTAKLDILYRIAHEDNVLDVLRELQDYATEIDVNFARKAINAIGRLALKFESVSDACMHALEDILKSNVNYAFQEAIVAVRDIFRKYPHRYDSIITTLCDNLDFLDDPQAKVAMIWILGHYTDRIEKSHALLDTFLQNFLDETVEIQLALLTATVKLFLKRPNVGGPLIEKVLTWTTEQVANPDCRDRGFFYTRLLALDPVIAKKVVFSDNGSIEVTLDRMDRKVLDQLLLQTGSLSSVYHKNPQTLSLGTRPRYLPDSPALEETARQYASSHLQEQPPLRVYQPVRTTDMIPEYPSMLSTTTMEDSISFSDAKTEMPTVKVGKLI